MPLLAETQTDPVLILVFIIGMMGMAALGYYHGRRSSPVQARPSPESRDAAAQAARTHHERESSAFQQHTELNGLAAQKFKREVELRDIQLQLAKFDLGMRHDHRDYHDLVMEKALLEIESLKLHIKEQQKRTDDFGSSDDH